MVERGRRIEAELRIELQSLQAAVDADRAAVQRHTVKPIETQSNPVKPSKTYENIVKPNESQKKPVENQSTRGKIDLIF